MNGMLLYESGIRKHSWALACGHRRLGGLDEHALEASRKQEAALGLAFGAVESAPVPLSSEVQSESAPMRKDNGCHTRSAKKPSST